MKCMYYVTDGLKDALKIGHVYISMVTLLYSQQVFLTSLFASRWPFYFYFLISLVHSFIYYYFAAP